MIARDGKLIVRDSVESDIGELKDKLRPEDRAEIWASHRQLGEDALVYGYEHSTLCYTLCVGDHPIAMMGVVPSTLMGDEACVWMLGTSEMARHKKSFVKLSIPVIQIMLKYYPYLYNFVDSRYQRSVAWLAKCGANIFKPVPFGPDGVPFHFFEFKREA